MKEAPPVKKEIRNLLLVLLSAVLFAFLFAAGMLYYYNPSGRYIAGNVLLAPDLLTKLDYTDHDQKVGKILRYTLSGIELHDYNAEKKIWTRHTVTPEQYRTFYESIASQSSLRSGIEQAEAAFREGNPASLYIKVKNSDAASAPVTFLEVQFAKQGDYFRIQLRNHNPNEPWAYFFHPRIYRDVMQIFEAAND